MGVLSDIVGSGVGDLAGGLIQAGAAKKSSQQLQAGVDAARGTYSNYAGAAQNDLRAGQAQGAAYQQPWYNAGANQLQNLNAGLDAGAYNTPTGNFQFGADQMRADPGYQFRQQEGMNAIENSAAKRGSLFSGATMKALAKYGSNLASQEYGAAYNRNRGQFTEDRQFNATENQNRYNRGYNLAALGQGSANTLTNLAYNTGSGLSNINRDSAQSMSGFDIDKANAQATGTMGVAQGYANALGAGSRTLGNIMPSYSPSPQSPQQVARDRFNKNFGGL